MREIHVVNGQFYVAGFNKKWNRIILVWGQQDFYIEIADCSKGKKRSKQCKAHSFTAFDVERDFELKRFENIQPVL